MPILYVNLTEQKSLMREPYCSFLKKFKGLKGKLNGAEVELRIEGSEGGSFVSGLYIDECYTKKPRIHFDFLKISEGTEGYKTKDVFFVRMSYIFGCGEFCDLEYYMHKIHDLKRCAPYFYIPSVSHLEFSSQIDDEISLQFDVIVPDEARVQEVCCALINQLIAVLSFDD